MKHLRHQSHEKRYMKVTLGSCWGHFGHMEVPLDHFGPLWSHFKITLGAFGGHCGRMEVALGHFGVALGAL